MNETQLRFEHIDKILEDHESRIRELEQQIHGMKAKFSMLAVIAGLAGSGALRWLAGILHP